MARKCAPSVSSVRFSAQLPNYVTVLDRALGEPRSLHAVVLKLLWDFSDTAVPHDVQDGCLLLSDTDEWLPGRAMAWGNVNTDVLYVYNGSRDLKDVELTVNASLAQPAPSELSTEMEMQLTALWELTPTWVPVEEQSFRKVKEEASSRAAARDQKAADRKRAREKATPAGTEAAPEAAPAARKRAKKQPQPKKVAKAAPEPVEKKPTLPIIDEESSSTDDIVEEGVTSSDGSVTPTRSRDRSPERLQRSTRPSSPRTMPPPSSAPPRRTEVTPTRDDRDRRRDREEEREHPQSQPTRPRSDSRSSTVLSSPQHRTERSTSGSQHRGRSPRGALDEQLRRAADNREVRADRGPQSERARRQEEEDRRNRDAARRRADREADRRREEEDRKRRAGRSFFDVRRRK